GLAEDEDVGAAGGAEQDLAGDDRLHEVGTAAKRNVLDVEILGAKESLLDGDDERPGQRVVAEHGGTDVDRGLGPHERGRQRAGHDGAGGGDEETTPADG